jgi:hypothetical protein
MCFKIAGAEKTGEWAGPIWTRRWIEEKANAAKTAGGQKSGGWKPPIEAPSRIEEKASAARRLPGFLKDEVSALKIQALSKIYGVRHEKDAYFITDFAGVFFAGCRRYNHL